MGHHYTTVMYFFTPCRAPVLQCINLETPENASTLVFNGVRFGDDDHVRDTRMDPRSGGGSGGGRDDRRTSGGGSGAGRGRGGGGGSRRVHIDTAPPLGTVVL